MRIVLAGGSGLVGSSLNPELTGAGHDVWRLVRGTPAASGSSIAWDPDREALNLEQAAPIDAVVCLSGESIAGRWTARKKEAIRKSRVRTAALLARRAAELEPRPASLVCASAVGIYGDRGDAVLTEASDHGTGFLAEVCAEWEAALEPARRAGIRTVSLRFGVVLTPRGGMLAQLLPLFRLGLGGPVGSGEQYLSWLTLRDAVGMIAFALTDQRAEGPINCVSPNPVTNAEFTRALARAVERPAVLRAPAMGIRLALGEMGKELVLSSARAAPEKLCEIGYPFEDREIGPALERMLAGARNDHETESL